MAGKHDVVIIGGGAIGLCSAYYLNRKGYSVAILEKGNVGSGSSSGNAGLIVPSHVVPLAAPGVVAQGLKWMLRRDSPFRIKPRLSPALAAWLWRFMASSTEAHVKRSIPVLRDLSLESLALFEQLSAAEGIAFGFKKTGLLMLYNSEKGHKGNMHEADLAEGAGLEVRRLDQAALRALEPGIRTPATGGVYYVQDAIIDPGAFLLSLRQHLEANGVQIETGTTVTDFELKNRRIERVLTSRGDFEGHEVVLSAGTWSAGLGRMLGLRIPLQAAKGYSVTLDAAESPLRIPLILTEQKVTVTPMGQRLRFGGTLELAGLDPSIDRIRARPILKTATEYVLGQTPEAMEKVGIWSGFRPCTPDGMPLQGRMQGIENLLVATGHAMIGITLAPVTGRLVADQLNGNALGIDMTALSVERFG